MTTQINVPHMTQVRQSLLDTLSDLRNRAQPMDLDRARAVAQVASVLIDTAKVEVEYLKVTGQSNSDFLDQPPGVTRIEAPTANQPFPNRTQHRLGA